MNSAGGKRRWRNLCKCLSKLHYLLINNLKTLNQQKSHKLNPEVSGCGFLLPFKAGSLLFVFALEIELEVMTFDEF